MQVSHQPVQLNKLAILRCLSTLDVTQQALPGILRTRQVGIAHKKLETLARASAWSQRNVRTVQYTSSRGGAIGTI
jgi:hypothetical protein